MRICPTFMHICPMHIHPMTHVRPMSHNMHSLLCHALHYCFLLTLQVYCTLYHDIKVGSNTSIRTVGKFERAIQQLRNGRSVMLTRMIAHDAAVAGAVSMRFEVCFDGDALRRVMRPLLAGDDICERRLQFCRDVVSIFAWYHLQMFALQYIATPLPTEVRCTPLPGAHHRLMHALSPMYPPTANATAARADAHCTLSALRLD
jgi:hypothetical protein